MRDDASWDAPESEPASAHEVERRLTEAIEALRAGVAPAGEREAVFMAADRAVSACAATLADVNGQIAELERMLGEDGEAVQAASMCLMRSGI